MDKPEFLELGEKERKILLEALNIDIHHMKCEYCQKPLDYKTCSIMPGNDKKVIIICNSSMCMSEYITRVKWIDEKFRHELEELNKDELIDMILKENE